MKVEIESEFDGSFESHSIKKKSITIGRSKECDISIKADGISRKHVEIIENSDGSFTITDLGSSNGTFINEEKLEPNQTKEFTFFFPAKLGYGIIVSLVEDDGVSSDGKSGGGDDKDDDAAAFLASQGIKTGGSASTKMKLESTKRASGGRSGGSTRRYGGKSKKGKKDEDKKIKEKKPMGLGPKFLILGVLAYGYWEFYAKKEIKKQDAPPVKVVQKKSNTATKKKPIVKRKTKFAFPADFNSIINREKCFTPEERNMCANIVKTSFADGVGIVNDTAYVVFDGTKQYRKLKSTYKIEKSEVPTLERLAKRQLGIKYSKVLFLRSNYKISANTRVDLGKYMVASVLFDSNLMNSFKNNQMLKKLGVIAYRQANGKLVPVGTGLITKEDLKQVEVNGDQSLQKAFKYAFVSGYKLDFHRMIWRHFNKPNQ